VTRLVLNKENSSQVVETAVDVINRGGVIIYPTDTSYGIAVDALNTGAVQKVFELKRRLPSKPLHVVVADIESAKPYVQLNDRARALAQKFLPGPLTLVLPKTPLVPDLLTGGLPTLGIRVPNNTFCLELAKALGNPYTATSANISDMGDCYSIEDILTQYGDEINSVDLIVDGGVLLRTMPSTVVGISGSEPTVLREGPISSSEIVSSLTK